ncbi:MAG: HlyC/CorC family transporter [Treponema sp.]|nr:HlyC/CorC family transporter [Treponema sp.]
MSLVKIILTFIALIFLVICVAFFSSSETAFLSLRKIRIRRMIQEKRPNAKLVQTLKKDMDSFLTTVLIGTNFVNSLASALATALAVELMGNGGVGVVTVVISFMITVFGQIVPKTLAGVKTEETASFSSLPIYILQKIFFPIIWLFSGISKLAVILGGKIFKQSNSGITTEEIETLIQVGETEGTLEKDESKMLKKVFSFNDLSVNDIMHHRSFVSMVKENDSYSEVTAEFLNSGYSTIAVCRESMEEVTGVIAYKKVLFDSETKGAEDEKGYAKKIMEPVVYVPGTLTILELLEIFTKEERKFAVVLDEGGGTSGVVTMNDVMRVVFGKMSNENNSEEIPPENRVKILSPLEFLLPGDLSLEDVNNLLKLDLESDYYNTLGGWVLEHFGFLPYSGQVLIYKKNLFIVEEQVNRRIMSVKIRLCN